MAQPERPRRGVIRDSAPTAADSDYHFGVLTTLSGFAVRCMHQYLVAGLASVVEQEGLKPHQFTALSLIVDNPGISQRDVAQALTIKPSNMVPLIDELELRGFVKRNAAATNRRSYALTASRDGRRFRDRALAVIAGHEENLLRFLNDDERAFLAGLTQRLDAHVRGRPASD
ncbi:MarR family winged helix-turn-helix transcriptional regulator [Sphingomonas sp.]|uniref:MarR family winged helix-turn-helix transcriptional regulator n=1 Tax=Sphingomonas sp. TaxID=28214 RepID=UPI002EDA4B8C